MTLVLGVLIGQSSFAEDTSSLNLKCKVEQCSPQANCQTPYRLGSYTLGINAGSEFIFTLTDNWDVSADEYRLDNVRYVGDSYLSRTTLNMNVNRRSNAFKLGITSLMSGSAPREVVAVGVCEVIRATPITF